MKLKNNKVILCGSARGLIITKEIRKSHSYQLLPNSLIIRY